MNRERTSRILVVEDQEDVRRLLVTALELQGHEVDEAANAHDGLQRLRVARYELVLSDYAMPGGTGTWMLSEASREGLLDDTLALILTAHTEVSDFSDVTVIAKPLDIDAFLEQVKTVLANHEDDAHPPGTDPAYRVELVLYISSASPASLQARRNLDGVLRQFDTSQIHLSVWDLERHPFAGERDRVAFTPTLVKRFPNPPVWIVGNLREQEAVSDLLRACGVDAKA